MKGRLTAEDAISSPTTDALPAVHVIIVNYRTAPLALAAAQSALDQRLDGRRLLVHILDNASPGTDARDLEDGIAARNWQGRVSLRCERHNHGFGRGNNLVLFDLAAREPDSLVLLLNPDATLEPGALARLVRLLDDRPDVAGVGAGILLPDGTPATGAFRFPSLLGEFEFAANFGPASRLLARYRIPLPPDQPAGPVDWVAGAAVLFRLSALARVGFFDPGFFLYYEEVDLMRRLQRHGLPVWHLPQARVRHSEGTSTGIRSGQRTRRPAYWFHSWQHYHRRAAGKAKAIALALAHLAGALLNVTQNRLRGQEPSLPAHYLRDFSRFAFLPLFRRKDPRHD